MSVNSSAHGIGSLIVEITEELEVEETVVIENYIQRLTSEIRTLDLEDKGDVEEFSNLVEDVANERGLSGGIASVSTDSVLVDITLKQAVATESYGEVSGIDSITTTNVSTQ